MTKKAQEDAIIPEETEVLEQEGKPGIEWRNIASEGKPPIWIRGYTEHYHRVMFVERSSENETEKVQLMVNGEVLLITRGEEIVLPDRFLECAQHTKQPRHKLVPNQPMKVVGQIQTYAYHVVKKDVGKADFDKMKKKGDKIVREMLDKQAKDDGET